MTLLLSMFLSDDGGCSWCWHELTQIEWSWVRVRPGEEGRPSNPVRSLGSELGVLRLLRFHQLIFIRHEGSVIRVRSG